MNDNIALKKDAAEKYADFCRALDKIHLSLSGHEALSQTLQFVFSLSSFVSETCVRHPDIMWDLATNGDLFRPYGENEFREKLKKALAGVVTEDQLKSALVLFRKREMVRVAFRDLSGWATLAETLSELSGFADGCIDEALHWLYAGHVRQWGQPGNAKGEPQHLIVVGMGKLGANALNFSSDVDLVFAYPENGQTTGGALPSLTNEAFFTRLAQRLIHVLGSATAQGQLFRVDMRLRPFGENGPLVLSFDNMEDYYQIQGREWERYAWIRARIVAGDISAGNALLEKMKPFVYRRYLDYTVIDALREMKAMIALEVKRKEMVHHVKLGPGGIREIEFFCQMFQILRGGVMPALQGGDTFGILNLLAGENLIASKAWNDLTTAYCFLRKTENRLQEFSDAQVHSLPRGPMDQHRLALSMGFDGFEEFLAVLTGLMATAHGHFNQLLAGENQTKPDSDADSDLAQAWRHLKSFDKAREVLSDLGYKDPEKVLADLAYLKEASETRALSPGGRQRIDRLMPLLLKEAAMHGEADQVLGRIIDLVKVIERRTSYIALLLENPQVLTHLVRLANASTWIIRFLSQHPVLLDELLDPRTLYAPPGKKELEDELHGRLAGIPSDDMEYVIETLCVFKQVNVLRVAAADVTHVLPLMKVSDHLTEIAETVLDTVFQEAWRHMVDKHGLPWGCVSDKPADAGFLVVGYGKLGGIEMGYASDVDLVFLHSRAQGKTRGKSPVDNAFFYARLGQRMVHLLTSHTRAGVIYETDMRLRPSGNAGPLVSDIHGFLDYQMNHGWTWEHQALIRARAICGDSLVAGKFADIRRKVLKEKKDQNRLKSDVRSMRARIYKERSSTQAGWFDLKEDRGGILDIEFLVQYLVLAHAPMHENLLNWTDNVRLLEALAENNILSMEAAQRLKHAYLIFRSQIHKSNLGEKPPQTPIDQFLDIQQSVIEIWENYLS